MPFDFRSIFVDAPLEEVKGVYKNQNRIIDGDDFANNIEAALNEQARDGFSLKRMEMITSRKFGGSMQVCFTQGALLTFERNDKS